MTTNADAPVRSRFPRRGTELAIQRVVLGLVLGLVVALALTACAEGPDRSWRDLTVTLPEGWVVFEQQPDVLGLADGPLAGDGADQLREDVVAVQFQTDHTASADTWRSLLEEGEADVEVDETVELDGVPATRLQWTWRTNGVPTREMVVVVPSRSLVVLLQPVPRPGTTDGPDTFLAHAEEFQAILDSIDFGAPVDYGRDAGGS